MDPVTVSTTIGRPREEVFEYLADVANHPEFTDHFLVDWRLTREDSYGRGAGARFKIKAPLNRFDYADVTLTEVQPPYRIVELGRGGKFNRIRLTTTYTLTEGPGGTTQVEFTTETEPATITDRIMESFGARGWYRRKAAKAMRRLRSILEENQDRGRRATIAGR
jgi:uncharacterized protein YndB with AHSA1/START domain